jgi:dTMP kinase
MPARGLFITFEGGEGAGKSTQIRALAARLEARGHAVILTREPGGTPLAEDIRRIILSPGGPADAMIQALLFAAARRDHVTGLITPALAAGKIVLCDRFADSTRAYQGGKLPTAAIETMIALATDGLAPDLTFLLDLDPEIGLARARGRNAATDTFETADLAFHRQVRARFLALAEAEPARFARIDAAQAAASVETAIWNAFTARLGARATGQAS